MKKLPVHEYSSVVDLLTADFPALANAYGVVTGIALGEVWLEDNNILIIHGTNPILAMYQGNISVEAIDKIIKIISIHAHWVLFVATNEISTWMPSLAEYYQFNIIERISFRNYNDRIHHNVNLHQGFNLVEINTEDKLCQCQQYELIIGIYGNFTNYIKHSIGMAIQDKSSGELISEIHYFIGANFVEPSVITKPEYRGNGFSYYLTVKALDYSLNNHLTFDWSCRKSNTPSVFMAHKLSLSKLNNYLGFYKLT